MENFGGTKTMYTKGYEVCKEYEKLSRDTLISKCFQIAKDTELFVTASNYLEGLNKKNRKQLAMELRSLEKRKELMLRGT